MCRREYPHWKPEWNEEKGAVGKWKALFQSGSRMQVGHAQEKDGQPKGGQGMDNRKGKRN